MSKQMFKISNKPSAISVQLIALSLFLFIFCLLNVNTAFAGSATLSWTPPTTNVDSTPLTDLAGYKVYYGTSSGYYTQSIDINNTATTTYQVNNLTDGTTYYFAVTAYDTSNNESGYSNEACRTIGTTTCSGGGGGGDTQAPTVPAGLSAQAISSSQINLSWTASTDNVGVTGYSIYRDGTLIDTSATNSYSDSGLSASTTYTYTVSAYDAVGNASSQSSPISATTFSTNINTLKDNGDTEISGGGCGFVKDDNGKGPRAKGQGLSLMIMLIMTLAGIAAARRFSLLRNSTAFKTF